MEIAREVPDWVYIDSFLSTFSLADEHSKKVVGLMHELRNLETESVWAKRLALYEIARGNAWIRSFTSLSGRGIDGLIYPRLVHSEILRLISPGNVVSWEELGATVKGKDVIFEHGSYASVPTMAHVSYVNYATVGRVGANMNVLSLDSAQAIRDRKGLNKIVLVDDLRTELWRHIPGVDVVTVTSDFDGNSARSFWMEKTYPKLAQAATHLTLMCSYGDEVAREKKDYTISVKNSVKNIDARVVYKDNWSPEFGLPLYPQWTTTQWDEVSGRHEEFEKLARQYLVG